MKAIQRILELLNTGSYSQTEICEKLDMPYGTVRSTLSTLKTLGYVEATNKGTPWGLTPQGKKRIEELRIEQLKEGPKP